MEAFVSLCQTRNMNIPLKILILCRILIYAKITPGIHFNWNRVKKSHDVLNKKIPISLEEMKAHESNSSSSWVFDFEKFGHCARINVEPFILPKKFTVCYKSNHDIADRFVFLA